MIADAAPTPKAVALVLLPALVLTLAFAFSYVGAFHEPTPHQLPTAVVGTSVEAKVFAQKLNDGAHGALTVRTWGTLAGEGVAWRLNRAGHLFSAINESLWV